MRQLLFATFAASLVLVACKPDDDDNTSPPPAPTCTYDGVGYDEGDSFPATDGCNTCWCDASGMVGCTKIGCPAPSCDPDVEYGREYVGESPSECAVIRFTCPENTSYFANDCGCGCEQADTCPEYFNCMPGPQVAPCDIPALSTECPYSEFAF